MDLPAPIERLYERIKQVSTTVGRAVQRAVLSVLLFLLYYIGFGLTRLTAMAFARRYLKMFEGPSDAETYWLDAEGYKPDDRELDVQF